MAKKAKEKDPASLESLLKKVNDYFDYGSTDSSAEIVGLIQSAAQLGSAFAAYLLWLLYEKNSHPKIENLRDAIEPNADTAQMWKARALDGGYPAVLLADARVCLEAKDFKKAQQLVDRVLEMGPESVDLFGEIECADAKKDARHVRDEITAAIERAKVAEKLEMDPDKLKPAEIYNYALTVVSKMGATRAEVEEGLRLLDLAQKRGLIQAGKLAIAVRKKYRL